MTWDCVLCRANSALVAQPCLQSHSNCVENNPVSVESVERSRVVTAENGIPISTLHSNHSKCRTPPTTHHPPAARSWTVVTIYGWISLYPTFQSSTRLMTRRCLQSCCQASRSVYGEIQDKYCQCVPPPTLYCTLCLCPLCRDNLTI